MTSMLVLLFISLCPKVCLHGVNFPWILTGQQWSFILSFHSTCSTDSNCYYCSSDICLCAECFLWWNIPPHACPPLCVVSLFPPHSLDPFLHGLSSLGGGSGLSTDINMLLDFLFIYLNVEKLHIVALKGRGCFHLNA